MVRQLLFAWGLMAICVASHAVGVTAAGRWFEFGGTRRFWGWTRTFVSVAGWMVLIHLIEIVVWALFYVWKEAMPEFSSAVYFSAVTYTTTGYGDLVLPSNWRLVGAIEALTGILMCGWSTGFFFAIVSRMVEGEHK